MKTRFFLTVVILTTIPVLFAQDAVMPNKAKGQATITLKALGTPGTVLGKLSMPLGTVVKIEGTIEPLPASHPKGAEEFDWVRVNKVNGTALKTEVVLNCEWFNPAEKSRLAGQVNFVGYETGRFIGVPTAAFRYVPRVGSTDFGFESYFMLLKKL